MKLAVRVLTLSIVFAGLAAASVSSATTNVLPNHLSASASGPAIGASRFRSAALACLLASSTQ